MSAGLLLFLGSAWALAEAVAQWYLADECCEEWSRLGDVYAEVAEDERRWEGR